jgi:hypothetical protein
MHPYGRRRSKPYKFAQPSVTGAVRGNIVTCSDIAAPLCSLTLRLNHCSSLLTSVALSSALEFRHPDCPKPYPAAGALISQQRRECRTMESCVCPSKSCSKLHSSRVRVLFRHTDRRLRSRPALAPRKPSAHALQLQNTSGALPACPSYTASVTCERLTVLMNEPASVGMPRLPLAAGATGMPQALLRIDLIGSPVPMRPLTAPSDTCHADPLSLGGHTRACWCSFRTAATQSSRLQGTGSPQPPPPQSTEPPELHTGRCRMSDAADCVDSL